MIIGLMSFYNRFLLDHDYHWMQVMVYNTRELVSVAPQDLK